jgi:hypothetical protein
LYLHNNYLEKLEKEEFIKLKNLTHLSLNNNKLKDFWDSVNVLKKLKNLQELDLYENSLCDEPFYKLKIVHELRTLKIFDKNSIKNEDLINANKFFNSDAKNLKKTKKQLNPKSDIKNFSKNEKILFFSVKKFEKDKLEKKKQEEGEKERIKSNLNSRKGK